MAILEVRNLKKGFGSTDVLKGVSFELEKGQVLAIIGSSGSGKTTLLRCLNFLETADAGEILVDGKCLTGSQFSEEEIRQNRLHFGLVFQNFNLFPQYTVLENITAVMPRGDKREAKKRAKLILEAFGLAGAENLYPEELSTGMSARVSLARAVAYDANIYLMDEPFKSLDPEIKRSVVAYLKSFFADKAVAIISHDRAEADLLGACPYLMENGVLVKTDL